MNIPRDTMCNNTATGASKKINAAYGMDTGGKGGNICLLYTSRCV